MYLICCAAIQTKLIITSLKKFKIGALPLKLVNINYLIDNINYLKLNIDKVNYAIFTSPTAINVAKNIITKATKATFLTVGEASYRKMSILTQLLILYPKLGSGANALINECLENLSLINKQSLIITSTNGALLLRDYFINKKANFVTIDIYKQIINYNLNLKKVLADNNCQGIIITSSNFVQLLFKLTSNNGCIKQLIEIPFITIHSNITKKLLEFGVNKVFTTPSANCSDIAWIINNIKTKDL